MLQENLKLTQNKIAAACDRVGRNPHEVTLIAVSKTKPLTDIEALMDYQVYEFGENKVQELVQKYETIKSPVHWHMIGHLQTNKVKYIIDKVSLIHSVDSIKLAKQIQKEASKHDVTANILIQVNIAKEETKFGVSKEEVLPLVEEISSFPNIIVKGLMTTAPFVNDAENNRTYFKEMRELFVDISSKNIDNIDMQVLSMGMTNDYEIAIEEGATMVRVGTGIFGSR